MFEIALVLTFALFITWLESVEPRKALGYPILEMDRDVPSILGPLSPCQEGGALPCLDPLKECVIVSEENSIYIGDIPVPKGLWCLPSGKPKNCGTLTGKQVWTADGWRCICLYPDVAGGEDCSKKSACDCEGNVDCVNTLKSDSGGVYTGEGNPYNLNVSCTCQEPLADSAMLKADPLRCHKDPCTPDGRAPGIFKEGKCQCQLLNWIESNVDAKCHPPESNCLWDYDKKECKCGAGQFPVYCQSNLYTRPDYITERCDGNAGGCVCKNPCQGYCQNGSIPHIAPNPEKPGTYLCSCSCVPKDNKCYRGPQCDDFCYNKYDDIGMGSLDKCCYGGGETCVRWSAATDTCLRKRYDCNARKGCP